MNFNRNLVNVDDVLVLSFSLEHRFIVPETVLDIYVFNPIFLSLTFFLSRKLFISSTGMLDIYVYKYITNTNQLILYKATTASMNVLYVLQFEWGE